MMNIEKAVEKQIRDHLNHRPSWAVSEPSRPQSASS